MADVINEVVEASKDLGLETKVIEPIVEGPTIFKTSNTAKVVFGVVVGVATAYGLYKGVTCVLKKRKETKEVKPIDIPEEFEDDDIFEDAIED